MMHLRLLPGGILCILFLAFSACSSPDAGRGLGYAEWREASAGQRFELLEQCMVNDFTNLVGQGREMVVTLLGAPDSSARFSPSAPDKPYEHLYYKCGDFCDNPGTVEYDPQVHVGLVVVLDDHAKVTAIRFSLDNWPVGFP